MLVFNEDPRDKSSHNLLITETAAIKIVYIEHFTALPEADFVFRLSQRPL
jgi:hypothetical protein